MTWKSHCIANGAVAWALTGRPEVVVAAIITATLPDRVEALLPFGRHRGASHWVAVWLGLMVAAPSFACRGWGDHAAYFYGHVPNRPGGGALAGAVMFGLALGPFLHVLLDGCSDSGVPVAPFSRQVLRLGMYRTRSHRWRWDVSEWLFLVVLVSACVAFWRIQK